jgi:ribose transport system substrate-binding protein
MRRRVERPGTGQQPSPRNREETEPPSEAGASRYYTEVLGKRLDILDVLRNSRTELRLTDIACSAKLNVSTAFRLLRTLEGRGYVSRDKRTKRFKQCLGYRTYRIGYAQLAGDQHFAQKVTQSLADAAGEFGIDLLVTDNRDNPDVAVKNAAWLISLKVDFVIEYDFHYRVGAALANMFREAGIPMLAIDIPMPGAIYFGVSNYAAGYVGGDCLAGFAQSNWRGRADRILLLEIPEAGPVPHERITGTLDGMRGVLPKLDDRRVLRRNGEGTEMGGYLATRRVLGSLTKRAHLLIAAANDECARGAIRAVHEAGREEITAIMAQGWGPGDGVEDEISKSGSPLIGAVAYFPEKYGSQILPVVLQCLSGEAVPPAVYVEHKLITRDQAESSAAA